METEPRTLSESFIQAEPGKSQRTEQSRLVAQCSLRNDQIIQIMRVKYMSLQTLLEWFKQQLTSL